MGIKHIFSKKNRALLSELVRTDFKLRYQGSAIGYTWSLLKPLFLFSILYLVFVKFLKLGNGVPHYPAYLLLGIVLWSFFVEMTSMSLSSVVARGDLIRKIRIPRWIIIVSSSVSAMINLLLNLVVVAIFMVINHVEVGRSILLVPLLFLQIYIVSLGISLYLSAAFVKFRDVSHIWDVIVQAGFYLTPILYPLQRIKGIFFQKIMLMNPLAQSIQDVRHAVITPETLTVRSVYGSFWPYIVTISISLILLIMGVLYFKKESKYFAENI